MTSILGFTVSEAPGRLEALRSDIVDWSDELASAGWPDSICHGDLHGDNAIIQENGAILIYDWEDAVLSCPFLSIERLMVEAWCYDAQSTSAPWGYIAGTPGQNAVRDAYIDELPWKTRAERVRACTVAECLAVMKEACFEQRWAEAMGMMDGNPEWTAQLISRLYQHRKAIAV